MATRNPVSVTRAQKLPPIREETSTGLTGRLRTQPDIQYQVRKSRRNPSDNNPIVRARPLPSEGTVHARPLPSKEPFFTTRYNPAPKHIPPGAPLTPMDSTNTLVDGLVADYLHYAKYGHIIPVYEGSGTLSCPCCTDRNRENVRTLLGFPSPENSVKGSISNRQLQDTYVPNDTHWIPKDSPTQLSTDPITTSPRSHGDQSRLNWPSTAGDKNWLNYQPLPYATNYLNPEFNRPALVYNYQSNQTPGNENEYVKNQVISANKQYEDSMAKLQKFGL